MKNRYKIILVLAISSTLSNCNKNENINQTQEDISALKQSIKNDNDFKQLTIENFEFSEKLIKKLKKSKINLIETGNSEQTLKNLGFYEEYKLHTLKVNEHLSNIKRKYTNINSLSENELLFALEDLKLVYKNNINHLQKTSLVDECDDKFEADFHTMHAEYDRAVTWCTVLTLLTFGIASPCYGVAVTDAIVSKVVAIEEHSRCKKS
jgi:hypothetical protein